MSNPHPSPDVQFKPGQSGNPNGRPKKAWTWAGLIEDALEEQDETGISYKKSVIKRLRTLAHRGDLGAIKEIFNRTEGMPKQAIEQSGTVNVVIPILGGVTKVENKTPDSEVQ